MRGRAPPEEGTSVDKGPRPRKYSRNTQALWGVCGSGSEGGGLRSCHLHRHMGDPRRAGGRGNTGQGHVRLPPPVCWVGGPGPGEQGRGGPRSIPPLRLSSTLKRT